MTTTATMPSSHYAYSSNPNPNPNPSDPSDPSNFSTPLSPPGSSRPCPRNPFTPSSSTPTLPSITHSLLQIALFLKRDFRFLKLTTASCPAFSLDIAIEYNSEGIHTLLQTSLYRLNSSTRNFVRKANILLDEEVNRSFDAYLHGQLPLHRDGQRHFKDYVEDSGYSSPLSSDGDEDKNDDGGEDEIEDTMMMTVEEKETRKELKRLVGVVEELRGVFFKKAGKYVLKGGKKAMGNREVGDGAGDGEVEYLVVGRLFGDGEGEGKGRRGGEDVKMGLERLVGRLGMGKREEYQVRVCRI